MNRGIIFWRKVALVHGIRNEATSMKLYEPCFAAQFHCLAGACPDTCCKDWEIILDEKTLARYRALPGVFGDEVRNALTTDAEGDTMFRLTDGHCPLLSSDGLCRVQLSLGEEALCDTCRAHPRFYEEYGQTKELTLSISCPAAIDLLFAQETPIKFVCCEDGAPVSGCNDLDPDRYFALRRARDTAISITQNRALPISDRLSLLLLFAVRLQRLIDAEAYGRLDGLLARFSDDRAVRRALARAKRMQSKPSAFFPCWMLLNNMEHLTQEFPRMLDSQSMQRPQRVFDPDFSAQWEHLTVYFLWRYFLKASVDGQVLSQTESCLLHVLCIAALFSCQDARNLQTLSTLASLYSKEVEHSDENLRLLLRVFDRKTLSWKTLLSLLG